MANGRIKYTQVGTVQNIQRIYAESFKTNTPSTTMKIEHEPSNIKALRKKANRLLSKIDKKKKFAKDSPATAILEIEDALKTTTETQPRLLFLLARLHFHEKNYKGCIQICQDLFDCTESSKHHHILNEYIKKSEEEISRLQAENNINDPEEKNNPEQSFYMVQHQECNQDAEVKHEQTNFFSNALHSLGLWKKQTSSASPSPTNLHAPNTP